METENNLTAEEFGSLLELKEEHEPYFDAMMYAARVIVQRNHKYTGNDKDRDVFANFVLDAQIQNKSVQEIFRQWVSKKTVRIMLNDGDYADESFTDSLRDLANFSLLFIGWLFDIEKMNNRIMPLAISSKDKNSKFTLGAIAGNSKE